MHLLPMCTSICQVMGRPCPRSVCHTAAGEVHGTPLPMYRSNTSSYQRWAPFAQESSAAHCHSSFPLRMPDGCPCSCISLSFNRFHASQHIFPGCRATFPLSSPSLRAPCIPSTSNSKVRQPATGLRRSGRWHCRCSVAPHPREQDARLKKDASRSEALRLVEPGFEVVVLWRFAGQWTGGDGKLVVPVLIFQVFDLRSQ
jgi:hypothetical protein